jgi:hypothetical protein
MDLELLEVSVHLQQIVEAWHGLRPVAHGSAKTAAPDNVDGLKRDRVRGMGIRIEWHVAEKKAADAIRKLFKDNAIEEITVIHTPAL